MTTTEGDPAISTQTGGPRSGPEPAPGAIPTGNTFDKYGSSNRVVRRLMSGFERRLDELFAIAAPASILDIGCGEGVLTEKWAQRLGERRVVGFDLDDPKLAAQWASRARPNLRFETGDAKRLPYGDGEFDMVAAIEALEHIPDPDRAVAEMARVAASHLLVSVPHEPLWRLLNIARGAYLRELGNTPGHINHFTAGEFTRLLARHGAVVQARSPFPWTMLLVRLR
ncbi:MAG: class I SAM-dependent methyltransferase [Solirubrobacteraceae bacterium]